MIELKKIDSFFNNNVGPDGADVLLMNACTQGSGAGNRIGQQITITSIQFRGHIENDIDNLSSASIRCIVFWDRQPNNANPITTTFTVTSMALLDGSTITNPMHMPYNYQALTRYRILYDKIFTVTPNTFLQYTTTGGVSLVDTYSQRKIYFKKKIKASRLVQYDASAGDITDLTSNSLFAVFYSDAAQDEPVLQFAARVYYKDA